MRQNYTGIFEVIGPIMVGPSSSHTSGAATIAWMARQIFNKVPVRASFTLYGSFADTYKGHGTDRALIGGILGYRSYDVRIRDAYKNAADEGVAIEFIEDHESEMPHPNTVDILQEAADGSSLFIRAESIGGGRVRITQINDIQVDFNGDYSTLIIGHKDEAGTIAYITGRLAEHNVNIAFMKLFREERGENAVTVIETDDFIPVELKNELLDYNSVEAVEVIEL